MTAASLSQLVMAYPSLRGKSVLQRVLGISERALKARLSRNPNATLSVEQSQRARQLAEILEKATQVLGEREAAEAWMGRRAMGLDGMVPLDLLALPDGFPMLRDHLIRMEYGVYI
jgi:putative toxin-antitoxin system antitoxin component (TIGR02293 family)